MTMPDQPLPTIAFAMGDPAGISPELAAKLIALDEVRSAAQLLLFGDRRILAMGAKVAGAVPDIEVVARETLSLTTKLTEILAQHTGQPYEKVKHDTERDYYMTAEEAKEYGLVDEVLEPSKVLAGVTNLVEPSENGRGKG